MKNSTGKSRTLQGNKMIILALKAALRMALEFWDVTEISWTALESRVAEDFHYRREALTEIRKHFFESEGAEVLVLIRAGRGSSQRQGKVHRK